MHTENGPLVDLRQVEQIVNRADVFTIAFRLFPERLLVDTRHDANDAGGPCGMPMVAIVDPVESVEDRYFWLGQHRPGLGSPESFMFFYWPHSIRYLEESGIWAAVRGRVIPEGFAGATETLRAALADLYGREHAAQVEAIRGEKHQTLWEAPQRR